MTLTLGWEICDHPKPTQREPTNTYRRLQREKHPAPPNPNPNRGGPNTPEEAAAAQIAPFPQKPCMSMSSSTHHSRQSSKNFLAVLYVVYLSSCPRAQSYFHDPSHLVKYGIMLPTLSTPTSFSSNISPRKKKKKKKKTKSTIRFCFPASRGIRFDSTTP
ncbi:hypothetical protein BO86DRAFT_31021 [Aspergillus japonicus CBS 114.51]|uniref:Uncharacterized protein n=1 Tax=Aspergillus japonicus CBS 114.51 TaxID=1448312 RepID=A0A8T8X649_ASPJA|nr:hypothetical protein BO86DRAFT_31021 [Aspergillus japonicus CBS 114.51]RAH83647.1 hypothetical protein BO86DRAFT_31021 [Aspergillus japonicus CBS 114.51]